MSATTTNSTGCELDRSTIERTASTTWTRSTPHTAPLLPRVGITTDTSGRWVGQPAVDPVHAVDGRPLDRGGDAHPLAVVAHGAHAGVERPLLVRRRGGHARRRLAPEVQQLGHVHHRAELAEAEHEVVVLRAVEAVAEPAHLEHRVAAGHDQVRDVVRAAQPLGRPVGLVRRRGDAAVDAQQGVVAVRHHGVGSRLERGDHRLQRTRHQLVVVVEQRDVRAASLVQRPVRRRDDAAVDVEPDRAHTPVAARRARRRSGPRRATPSRRRPPRAPSSPRSAPRPSAGSAGAARAASRTRR